MKQVLSIETPKGDSGTKSRASLRLKEKPVNNHYAGGPKK